MKILATLGKQKVAYIATILFVLGMLVLGMAASAYAVGPQPVFRRTDSQVFTGKCCNSWGETVSIFQKGKPTPVVVSWSTDFRLDPFISIVTGLMVNDEPCQFYGGGSFVQDVYTPGTEPWDSRTLQFVVPASEMNGGTNTFTLCGGGLGKDTDAISIGFNVLEVRISK